MSQAWAGLSERGASWGVWITAWVYRLLGRAVCRTMLIPVVAYFFLSGSVQRRASLDYLRRLWRAGHLRRRPALGAVFLHFLSFAYASLDKLVAWTGGIRAQDVEGVHDGLFKDAKANGRGAVVITAHVGNPEVIRAIATVGRRFRVNVLVHTLHAERFNRIIQRFSPDSPVRLVQVTQIDLGVAMRLSEAVARGEWVVIMGDRVAVQSGEKTAISVNFLGSPASQPMGPYVLAAALKCPAYTLFCFRDGKRFRVSFELLADPVVLPRRNRDTAVRDHAAVFAQRLEKAVAEAPFQWFNFYDYWAPQGRPGQADGEAA